MHLLPKVQAGLEVTPRDGQGWRSPVSSVHSQLLCVIAAIWFPRAKSPGKVAQNSRLLSSTWEMRVTVAANEELGPALGDCQERKQVTRVGAASQDTPAHPAAGQMGWGQWEGNPGIPWTLLSISVHFTQPLCWRRPATCQPPALPPSISAFYQDC